jgi:hypothetical protein
LGAPLRGVEERFWAKVCKWPGGCWEWKGQIGHGGYGRLFAGGRSRESKPAHRVSWELHYGPIPPDLFVCHHCDNPKCVRPSHLFIGTAADNVHDSMAKGRFNSARIRRTRTHCKNGHLYSEENTKTTPKGHRMCRECERQNSQRKKARKCAR